MEFKIGKIILAEQAGQIEVFVYVKETDKEQGNQSANIIVCLDLKNYTIAELKAEAEKAAKEFLLKAVK